MLDGSVTAQDVLAQPVVAVAESGLPSHDDVLGKIESDRDGVGHLASIFF